MRPLTVNWYRSIIIMNNMGNIIRRGQTGILDRPVFDGGGAVSMGNKSNIQHLSIQEAMHKTIKEGKRNE